MSMVTPPVRSRRPRSAYLRADLAVGMAIVGFWAFCALFPSVITDVDPTRIFQNGTTLLGEPLAPGKHGFALGTDVLGRDLLSRLVHGARVAMLMALVPNGLALLVATGVGVTAGMVRGKVEFVLMRITEAFMVLLEAGLGFLGFGVQPPTPSWGSMLAEARDQFFYPWLILLPGACLASLCIGFYALGHGLQHVGLPREKRVKL